MADQKHMVKRQGRWRLRLRVPKDVESHFGRSFIEEALGTADIVKARLERRKRLGKWQEAFEEARSLPPPDAYRSVLERYGLTGSATPDTVRRLREALSLESQIAADADAANEAYLESARASARAWVDGLSDGEVEALRTRALYAHRLPALLPGQPDRPIAAFATGAVVVPDEVLADLDRVEGKAVPAAPAAPEEGFTLTNAHALYLKETPDLSPRTRREWATAVKEFTSLHGDMQVKDITKVVMTEYKESMRSHITAKGMPRDPATVNKLLSGLRAILEVAINHGHLSEPNPAAKLSIKIKKRKGRKKRLPLLISEIEKVQIAPEDRDYWLWKLLVYTGARLGDIAQMHKADVIVRGGGPCVVIHDDDDHRRVKNEPSVRVVPVHRDIRADFVSWVQSRPDGPLWPRYWREVDGVQVPHTDPASKRLNRILLLAGVHSKKKCVHSVRHAYKDWLRAETKDEEKRDAITGHSGHGGVGRDYGDGHFIQKLRQEIDKIDLNAIKELQEADLSEWQQEADDDSAG